MDNPTIDLIRQHASVRHFKPDPVPVLLIETIASAAQRASSSSNMQPYSIVAVTDAARRERLAHLCGDQAHVREAPLFLAFIADLARLHRICEMRGVAQVTNYAENFLVACMDAVIAAQNAALAAESLGLGICYIGSIRNNPQEVIDMLALPPLTFPVTGMTVGWPAKPPRTRPRLPLRAVLHWEKYNPDQDEALHEYDQAMLATGIYEGRQVPAPGREGEMEEYGWLEHSARRVAVANRTNLREVLKKQGFDLE
ncbi:MAG: NADPH-dependent oxidoreductase [Chloroflexi bacterium]|nr:NADPH-dependent oxidoreductase [Chloroflexota bacterium]